MLQRFSSPFRSPANSNPNSSPVDPASNPPGATTGVGRNLFSFLSPVTTSTSTTPLTADLATVDEANASHATAGNPSNELTLSSPSLHVDGTEFFSLIQDKGIPFVNRKPTKHWAPDKSPHKIGYPGIYDCGDKIYRNLLAAPSLFPKIAKGNATRIRKTIMKFIFEMRTSYKRDQINSTAFPGRIAEYVANMPEVSVDQDVFILDQLALVTRIRTVFGETTSEEAAKPTANDRLRVFGILLSEDFLDDLRCLVDKRKRRRHEIDSPEFSTDAVYARVQLAFNNDDLEIGNPTEWEEAIEKYPNWSDLDPNDESRIKVPRTGPQMKWIFQNTMTAFNIMMKKFKMETGGGAGHASDVATWQDRPSHEIIDYNQENAFLTWVFMKDKEKQHPLAPCSETIPYGREAGSATVKQISPQRNLLNTDKLVQVMEKGANALASAIEKLGGDGPAEPALAVRTIEIFEALDKAELRKEKLEEMSESNPMKIQLLNSVESAIKALYTELGSVNSANE